MTAKAKGGTALERAIPRSIPVACKAKACKAKALDSWAQLDGESGMTEPLRDRNRT